MRIIFNTKIKRTLTSIILCILITLSLTACFGKPKNFFAEELTVTLTVDFKELKNDDFNLYLTCDDLVFTAKKETKADLKSAGYEISNLKAYCDEILNINNVPKEALVKKNDYYYFESSLITNGTKYTYLHFMFENSGNYWTCNFVCKSKDYSKLKKNIFNWADSIKFSK